MSAKLRKSKGKSDKKIWTSPSDKRLSNEWQGLTFDFLIGGEIVGALVHVTPVLRRATDIIESDSVGSRSFTYWSLTITNLFVTTGLKYEFKWLFEYQRYITLMLLQCFPNVGVYWRNTTRSSLVRHSGSKTHKNKQEITYSSYSGLHIWGFGSVNSLENRDLGVGLYNSRSCV